MRPSEAFEQQVHRIHELLEQGGATVSWNDHVLDPDNPGRRRQIDVTIRRGEHLTLVECRIHRNRQNVKWIEELMGRRESLGADVVIAVSSTGFTAGALAKAGRHGVITRDFRTLTDTEVAGWGGSIALTLYFYEYSDVQLLLGFSRSSVENLDLQALQAELKLRPGLQALFDAAARVLDPELSPRQEHEERSVRFDVRIDPEELRLCGEPVIDVEFLGRARLVSRPFSAPAVVAYGEPGAGATGRSATIEKFDVGETSIVHDGKRVAVLVDISGVPMPPMCQFRYARLVGEEEVEHESFELVGLDRLIVSTGTIDVSLFAKDGG